MVIAIPLSGAECMAIFIGGTGQGKAHRQSVGATKVNVQMAKNSRVHISIPTYMHGKILKDGE